MGRDSTGNYTSPSGQFVPGTTILSNVMNSKLNDIGGAITDSLDRQGRGGMLTYLRGIDGTINLPAYSFTDETTLGFRRAGSGDLRASKDGTDLQKWSTAEVRVYRSAFFENGITVDAGGLVVTAGGLTVMAGNTALGAGVTGPGGGALVVGNGLTITTGGATVTAGGVAVTSGGVTVSSGGANVTGALPAQGGVAPTSRFATSGAISTTSGHSHAMLGLTDFPAGATNNPVRLNVRTENSTTVDEWQDVRVGLSYDEASSAPGTGGSIYLSPREGIRITAGVAATATDPANALELVNGNLKLSGTAPNSTEVVPNSLTPTNIPKALALVTTDGGGGASVVWGFGIASVQINATEVRVNFASSFTPAPSAGEPQYVTIQQVLTQGEMAYPLPSSYTANRYDVRVHSTTTSTATPGTPGTISLASTARTLFIMAFGSQ